MTAFGKYKKWQFIDPKGWKKGQEIELPDFIFRAIRCADMSKVKIRNWRPLPTEKLSKAEKAMRLIELKFYIPSGNMVGKPARLMFFQEVIIYLLIDCEARTALVSMARRNGKTFLQACLVLLYLVGFLSEQNMSVGSFALGREQAGILFKQLSDMITLSPEIQPLCRIVPSSKRVIGLRTGAEYFCGSGEARTNLGRSFKYLVLDEAGSIKGPDNEYTQALRTSQASYDTATFVAISTQAPSDADYFSVMLDTAEREQPKDTVAILFETPEGIAIDDPDGWIYSNPGIGVFRSLDDMKSQADSAKRIPAQEGGFRNLSLNQRVALESLWLAPAVWKECGDKPDLEVFRNASHVSMGLDLSMRSDLTAAVLAARDDDGVIHLLPFVFSPESGMKDRENRDKAPYTTWVNNGQMVAVPGPTLDYEWLCEWLKMTLDDLGVGVNSIQFDRWRIAQLKSAAEQTGFAQEAEWVEVGQGYQSFSPRIEAFETYLLQRKMRHGLHPLLNMAAANAVVVRDPAGNRKIDKSKATQRIDPLVAAVMAVGAFMEQPAEFSVDMFIG